MTPFLHLFRQTARLILEHGSTQLPGFDSVAQCQVLLLDIYYDFSCQDLPPDLEDSHEEFFAPAQGWFQGLLTWNSPESLNNVRCAKL
jgi:exportin-2 (importin alpha re-exporter)